MQAVKSGAGFSTPLPSTTGSLTLGGLGSVLSPSALAPASRMGVMGGGGQAATASLTMGPCGPGLLWDQVQLWEPLVNVTIRL